MNFLTKVASSVILLFSLSNASEYVLDNSHTEVGFSVKHLMITNVKGSFKEYDADIDFDKNSFKFNKFSATVDAKSIDTGITKRDDHLRSADFFFTSEYPKITFVMSKYSGDKSEGVMVGDLTIRGITQKINLNVEFGGIIKDFKGNTRVGFTLTGDINRMDYDLKWNKALEFGGVAVSEKVKLIIEVEAIEL